MTEAKKYRVYIAGPISNVGNYNFPLFDHVAKQLRAQGCEVFNPADLARELIGPIEVIQNLSKEDHAIWRRRLLKHELDWICDHANVLYLLPGWEHSNGAKAERAVAIACNDIEIQEAEENVILPVDVDTGAKV